jgi:cellulose synthase/poly-beta-1,6-N-acetylglucosamine synthase-like glycosyltransferase/peptidoglycan/xylan/chitin deacetylase (PgdA/CDA1 family)
MSSRVRVAGLRRAPRAILAVITTLVLACMLAINGLANAEIVSETGARPAGNAGTVPAAIAEGGAVIDPTGRATVSSALPRKTVALTFDDGPDPRWTPAILAVLEHHGVDGTFFAVGSNITKYPEVVRQVVDSGSEVGLHTFTHTDLTTVSAQRLAEEMSQSQVALAGAAGVTSELVRPPYSSSTIALDDDDYHIVEALGDRGYLTVLSDIDSKDWETSLTVEQMLANATPAEGAGGTILFHDAGGDRSKTVAVLEQLIPRLRAEGYTFTTVGDAVGLTATTAPADAAHQMRGQVVLAAVAVSTGFVRVLTWLLVGVGLLVVARLALMVFLAQRHRRRRDDPRFSWGPPVVEPVSVVVPAYNERAGIADTLASLLASDHPIEIVVVDDGSTDGTADIAEAVPDPRVRVIRQRNAGKAAALNAGIAHARHELVVMMDGDTVFEPDTVRRLVQPLADARVGAVAGNAKVVNRRGLVARWQHLEYVVGFAIDRRVYDTLHCMPTVPGAVGAFRRSALVAVGGLSDDTLAEDTDLTIAIGRAGWHVVYEPRARGWTEAPTRLGQLWLQRYRWCYGTMQSMWKHRRALLDDGASGRMGRWGLLNLALFQVLLPLLAPLVDLFLIYGLIFLNPYTTAALWSAVLAVQLLAAAYALRMDGERLRDVWLVPLQQLVYRQLMYLVLIESVLTAFAGSRLRWHKLHRAGGLQTALAALTDGEQQRVTPGTGR